MEERRATIEQTVALAFAVRLPQSCPDIHTHERRGRLRFEMALAGLSFARASNSHCERLPLLSTRRVIASSTSTIRACRATVLVGTVSCLRPDALLTGRCAGTIWPLQHVSDRSRATVRVLRALITLVPVSHA